MEREQHQPELAGAKGLPSTSCGEVRLEGAQAGRRCSSAAEPGQAAETLMDFQHVAVKTTEFMDGILMPKQWVMLLFGFICFIQELCVQTVAMFVTGNSVYKAMTKPTEPPEQDQDRRRKRDEQDGGNDEEHDDDLICMQLHSRSLSKIPTLFGNPQRSLDKADRHKPQKARLLLKEAQRPQSTTLPQPVLVELQCVMASRLVNGSEAAPDADEDDNRGCSLDTSLDCANPSS